MKLFSRVRSLIGNLLLDLKYGGFVGGVKRTPFSDAGTSDTANTDYAALPFLFEDIIEPEDILVDIGCGKGREVNWWLDNYPSNSICGIELDSEIAGATASRLFSYQIPRYVLAVSSATSRLESL